MSDGIDNVGAADIILENFVKGIDFPLLFVFNAKYVKATQKHIVVNVKRYVQDFQEIFGHCAESNILQLFSVGIEMQLQHVSDTGVHIVNEQLRDLSVAHPDVLDTLLQYVRGQLRKPSSAISSNREKPKKVLNFDERLERNKIEQDSERADNLRRAKTSEKLRAESEATGTYKISCYCTNCGADNIRIIIPKGIRADKNCSEAVCPKCLVSNCVVRVICNVK